MKPALPTLAAALALAVACSGGGGGMTADAGPDAGDEPLDLSRATWVMTPVGDQPAGTTALAPDLTLTGSGELVVAWVDVIEREPRTIPVFTAEESADFAVEERDRADGSLFSPSIASAGDGDGVHLVYGGPGTTSSSDIFYTRRSGGAWSEPINLTGPLDPDDLSDSSPAVVATGGEVAVLFLARTPSQTTVENAGLYQIRFADPSAPGAIETILDRVEYDCSDIAARTDDAGAIHAVANCDRDGGARELLYLNDRSGSFVTQAADLGPSRSPISPDIALGPDSSIHLVWNGTLDCPGGTCRDVFHSRDLSVPSSATASSEDGGFIPRVAVDALGRVVVVFHRLGNVDDILWTYAEPGGSFVRTQLATANTPTTLDYQAGALEFSAQTGRAHMVFVRSFPDADPSNSDIVRAELSD